MPRLIDTPIRQAEHWQLTMQEQHVQTTEQSVQSPQLQPAIKKGRGVKLKK